MLAQSLTTGREALAFWGIIAIIAISAGIAYLIPPDTKLPDTNDS